MLEFGTDNYEVTELSRLAPFVLSINDNGNNELRIVIALARTGSSEEQENSLPDDDPKLRELLLRAKPVYEDMNRVYEILFESYIIYECRNESYTSLDNREIYRGKYLVIYEKSFLLDYYENVIDDFDFDSEKSNRRHYGIITENHIIDVISNEPPVIRKIRADRETADH
ncbi:MAG: hypothetical protein K2K57_00740 [Oscillospiraceae bacterium]|nr:hypothetical protein [Oscillospiraceae bacterium]